MKSVEILILNWNKNDLTTELLRDLDRAYVFAHKPAHLTVHLLDNGSEQPLELPSNLSIPVKYTKTAHNLGYSGGMRLLAQESKADLLWLMNNDCTMSSEQVQNLLNELPAVASEYGLFHFPVVENPNGSIQSKQCHWNKWIGWRTSDFNPATSFLGDKFVCPIISRDLVLRLHLFPTEFHSYGEDFDASFALQKSGVTATRSRAVRISHQLSSSRPVDALVAQEFKIRGGRNYIASALINYSRRSRNCNFPILFLKIWIVDLLVKSPLTMSSARTFFMWLRLPLDVFNFRGQIRRLRAIRELHWQMADSDVFKV